MKEPADSLSVEASLPDLKTAASLLCPLMAFSLWVGGARRMGRERGREISGVSSSSYKDQSYHIRAPPTGPHLTLITSLVVQSSSRIPLFLTPLTATSQASLSFTISQSLLKLTSIESVMPSNHLILCHPFSCLQSFPASGSFPMSQFFPSAGQSIGASASA